MVIKINLSIRMAATSCVWMPNRSPFLGSCQHVWGATKLVVTSTSNCTRPPSLSLFTVEAKSRTRREDRTARHSRIRKKVSFFSFNKLYFLSSCCFCYQFFNSINMTIDMNFWFSLSSDALTIVPLKIVESLRLSFNDCSPSLEIKLFQTKLLYSLNLADSILSQSKTILGMNHV